MGAPLIGVLPIRQSRGNSQADLKSLEPRRSSIVPTSPPTPPSSAVRKRMQKQKTSGTACELAVRSILHRNGVRFRVDFKPIATMRTRVDIGWKNVKLAVFIDGCFWHKCPEHFTPPKSNSDWWQKKLESNFERDGRITQELTSHGWTVLRFWEHESPELIAQTIVSHRTRLAGHTLQS